MVPGRTDMTLQVRSSPIEPTREDFRALAAKVMS
jgi:hypothetical protein